MQLNSILNLFMNVISWSTTANKPLCFLPQTKHLWLTGPAGLYQCPPSTLRAFYSQKFSKHLRRFARKRVSHPGDGNIFSLKQFSHKATNMTTSERKRKIMDVRHRILPLVNQDILTSPFLGQHKEVYQRVPTSPHCPY